ncbi:MAG: DsrE family protein [Pseudomonadota bacterium]|jgi:predicted peroxiredoxin
MSEKEEKTLYIGTCAGEDPERASMPFVMANAALAMDIKATVVLQGHGVYLARKGYVDNVLPGGGFPPIKKLVFEFLELGGQLRVCIPCIKERNIAESELIEGAETTAAGAVTVAALEADAVFVY